MSSRDKERRVIHFGEGALSYLQRTNDTIRDLDLLFATSDLSSSSERSLITRGYARLHNFFLSLFSSRILDPIVSSALQVERIENQSRNLIRVSRTELWA
ncbi:hypothetical protein KPH14_009123 [Odynerus spinipes]|uniref:Uncharacterized protein n=1 Tax=Odynerus spinipes TaxID=1348599 RepID=A0AAD9VQ86_9HYME|nr:hypothetical protein KPH14_009123 [Odynerus spinipes]